MRRDRASGFTLIELMIVVAIVGILASIAYPSYRESVMRANRAECMGVMVSLANALERRFSATSSYDGGIPNGFNAWCPADGEPAAARYNLAVDYQGDVTTFLITATPAGAQAADRCGNLTLNQKGEKDAGEDGCW